MTTKTTAPCGTTAGYQTHKRRGQEPCADCRRAQRDAMREYRASKAEVRDREYRYGLARNRAIRRLIDLHPAQFDALLAQERDRA